MPRLVFKFLCLVAAVSLSGAHFGVAQGLAWASMLAEQTSHSASLTEAVAATFDGDHPCDMCRVVQVETQKEQSDPVQKALKEFKPLSSGLCQWQQGTPELQPVLLRQITFAVHAAAPHDGFHDVAVPPPRIQTAA